MTKLESKIYNQEGKEVGKVALPDFVFAVPWNSDLVHQVVTSQRSNVRAGTAHTKDRSEVRGGGRKPWRQKGTGRARHGSRRSPLWRTGGVTFGSRTEKNYKKKINKKMRAKALYAVLSKKLSGGEVLFLDRIKIAEPKTKKAAEVLSSLSKIKGFERLSDSKKTMAHLALYERDETNLKSFKNLPQVSLGEVRNLNPVDVLQYKYLIISEPKKSIDLIVQRSK